MPLDFQEMEESVRDFWDEENIVEQVRESTEGNEPFFMIDGPPYLTGPPHMGQFQNKVTKDVMLRFKQMQGFDVHDQAGFDTHGLPNEVKTEEELGIENKNDIGTDISVAEFIEACKERAVKAQDVWRDVMWRLAVWQDFDDPYLTYDPDYIESEWWFIEQADERDMLYDAEKPIYWCGRCQTSLAGYEVTDEYREVTDDAIYVKFPVRGEDDEYLLAWTTTPWTVPGNMAILVNPEYEYAKVEVPEEGTLIIAEQLVEEVMANAGYDEDEWIVTETVAGEELAGMEYLHPLVEEVPEQEDLDDAYRNVHTVIAEEELVTLEEGTGVVHAASGHGPDDYEVVKQHSIPVFSPVDEEGDYTAEAGRYEGKNVYDANAEIVDDLDDNGYLFYAETVRHEFPHCWRCDARILYRAARQWFLEIDPIKDTMIEENRDVAWYPETAGSKRFHNWLEGAHDWCISRQNYWGVPLPVWECSDCDRRTVIGSFDELAGHADGLPDGFDPHKHVVDEISWECEDCGATMHRVEDIIDVWCDSGCAPFASLHYPFDSEEFEEKHPMDFIVEGSDQIRGWFYSLMFCSATLFDEAPYDQVLLQAFVLDEEGEKMSKSVGNVIDPQDVMDELGTDVPRFWVMENSKQWENAKVSIEEMREETRPVLSTYWNTAQFLADYGADVDRPDTVQPEDEWMLSRLNDLLYGAADLYDTCHYHELCREWEDLVVEDLSRWYVKLVRERVKNGDEAAIWTLQQVVRQATLAIAPIVPHVTEQVYQDLFADRASVHMEEFPAADEDTVDRELEQQMATVRDLIETVNAVRDREEMNLRWPAKKIVLSVTEDAKEAVERFDHVVEDRANVKEIEFGSVETRLVAEPDYAEIGPRFGGDAEDVARYIEEMDREQIEQLQDVGEIWLDDHQVREDDVTVREEAAGHVAGSEFAGGEVYLDTEMTPALEEEALVRELVRNVQEARKDAGLDVQDHITLYVWGADQVVTERQEMITGQINVDELVIGENGGSHRGTASFDDREIQFGFNEE
ncbi:MAG: isoleucine--tRNA ligase [Candidatus Nanohaloarchaea archaeon]|nr:isoleucine--tRNA ligase [Candidatus Nanohaloarchaea archaeon]